MKINVVAFREVRALLPLLIFLTFLVGSISWFVWNYEVSIVPEEKTKKMLIQIQEERPVTKVVKESKKKPIPAPIKYIEAKEIKPKPVVVKEKPVINITIINTDSTSKVNASKSITSKDLDEIRQMNTILELNTLYKELK